MDNDFQVALTTLETVNDMMFGAPRGALPEDQYQARVDLARRVFDVVWPSGLKLMDIVYGLQSGEAYGHGAKSPLNFTSRFMKAPSIKDLPPDKAMMVQAILADTFRLGLMCHLVIWQFPTRHRIDRVDMRKLEGEWLMESLVADHKMKPLDKAGEVSTLGIFDFFHRKVVEPVIKGLGIGFLARAQTPSFFRNIFCAGWLLAMSFDLATRE